MTVNEANSLKKAQLMLMDEIHIICVNNNINYYIAGGTLIGAIRHKGFIPWDVDMDIAMPREDYDRFKSVCETELSSKFKYVDYTSAQNYDKPHAIVCAKGTRLISKMESFTKERPNFGIFIDVFPLDKVPVDENERKKHIKKINQFKKLRYYRIPYYTSHSAIKRFGRRVIKILLSGISIYKLNEKFDNCMRMYNDKDSLEICNIAGRYTYEKESLKKEVFGTPVPVVFEGREYFAPEKYDKYLKHIYGDYMKLPPVDEQIGYLDTYERVEFGDLFDNTDYSFR